MIHIAELIEDKLTIEQSIIIIILTVFYKNCSYTGTLKICTLSYLKKGMLKKVSNVLNSFLPLLHDVVGLLEIYCLPYRMPRVAINAVVVRFATVAYVKRILIILVEIILFVHEELDINFISLLFDFLFL